MYAGTCIYVVPSVYISVNHPILIVVLVNCCT